VECPAENTWQRYLGGETALDAHLDACADCRMIYAALASSTVEVGSTIGRYVVLDVIGRGGMGIVYKAFDPELDRAIALKLVASGGNERLVREARTLAKLAHPNVVAVHDVGVIGEDVFVAMEYVPGVTLRQWMRGRAPREVVGALVHAARGLAAAHRSEIVHRDFKPENVMVGDDGRVRVLDFGLARSPRADASRAPTAGSGTATHDGVIAGTPPYMSPEQARGGVVDARSDQYSFCVVLYEALYGERPQPDAWPPVRRGVSRRVRNALAIGLRSDPARRHASMDAVIDALRERPIALYALAATTLIAGGIALYAFTRAPAARDACTTAADDVQRVWNPARRAELVALAGDALAARVDTWTAAWSTRRKELCAQTLKSDRDQSQDIAQQVGCLRRSLVSLDASLTLIPELKSDAAAIIDRAGSPTTCDSYERGTLDPATRARWMPVLRKLIAAKVALAAGRGDEAEAAARVAVEAARAQPESEVLGAALSVLGLVQAERGQFAAAQPTLLEAIRLATAAREDELVVESWLAMLLMAMRGNEKDVDAAIFGAEVAALKLPADSPSRCMVAARAGAIHSRRGENELAAEKLERALACWTPLASHADDLADTSFMLGLVKGKRAEWDPAARLLEAAVARWDAAHKERDDDYVMALDSLGTIAVVREDDAAAERWFRRSLETSTTAAGHLAYVLVRNHRCSEAAPLLAIARAHAPERGGALLGDAMCALDGGDAAHAKQLLEEARPLVDTGNVAQLALLDFTLARALLATGAPRAKARALAEQALARLAGHPVARHRRDIADWLATH
jgi:serine/threonine protein kinase